MSEPIILKIDVTKIDKARLFQGKNGAKYLDCIAWPSDNDQYGNDFRIVESVSKEERQSGVKGTIIGNAKFMNQGSNSGENQRQQQRQGNRPQGGQQRGVPNGVPPNDGLDDEECPF